MCVVLVCVCVFAPRSKNLDQVRNVLLEEMGNLEKDSVTLKNMEKELTVGLPLSPSLTPQLPISINTTRQKKHWDVTGVSAACCKKPGELGFQGSIRCWLIRFPQTRVLLIESMLSVLSSVRHTGGSSL